MASVQRYNFQPINFGEDPNAQQYGQPQVPGSTVTPIQPGQNDLRGQQITPGRSGRTTGTQALVDQQKQQLGKFTGFQPHQAVGTGDQSGVDRLAGAAERAIGTGLIPYGMAQPVGGVTAGSSGFQFNPNAPVGRARGYGEYGSVGAGSYAPSADTSAVRGQISSRLGELQGPDRAALQQRAFSLIQQQNDPIYAQRERQLGQKTAALGRVGSGIYNSELADLSTQRNREETQAQERLAMEAAAAELSDRRGILDATQGVYGQFAGQDVTDSGVQRGLRDEARGERDFGFGVDQARNQTDLANANLGLQENDFGLNVARTRADFAGRDADRALDAGSRNADIAFRNSDNQFQRTEADRSYGLQRGRFLSDEAGNAFQRGQSLRGEQRGERDALLDYQERGLGAQRGVFGDLSDQEGRELGYERNDRDELRGERGYQDDLARQAFEDQIRQQELEQQFQDSDFNRYDRYTGRLDDLGGQYDPTGLLGDQANNDQQSADDAFAGVGDFAAEYFARNQLARSGQAPPGAIRQPQVPDYRTTGTSFGRPAAPRQTSIDRYGFGPPRRGQ